MGALNEICFVSLGLLVVSLTPMACMEPQNVVAPVVQILRNPA